MSVTKDKERGSWYFTGYYRRGFQTKREAKEAEHAFLVGVKLASPALTLDDLFEQYVVDFHTMGLKEATLINTEDYYHSLIQKDLGKVKLSKLTAPVIIRWVSGISAREYRGKPYAVGTINKARKVLSKLLSYAVQLGYLRARMFRRTSAQRPLRRHRLTSGSHARMIALWSLWTISTGETCLPSYGARVYVRASYLLCVGAMWI